MADLRERIEDVWADRDEPDAVYDPDAVAAVREAIDLLDTGAARVAEVVDGGTFGMPCALILKRLTEGERHDKVVLDATLRAHGIAT